jgi:hypothetical protein
MEHSTEQKDKTVGPNIHLSLTRAVTRKQGDDYAKTIAGIESDLPLGVDALEALEQLDGTLEAFLTKREEAKPAEQPKPKPTASELEKLSWTPYKEGQSAGWIFTDKALKV